MKYILCYGDSNTWGCIPELFTRYDFDTRWPGVMQNILGEEYHIYENALNGRTTVYDDPIEEGRNGRTNFEVTLLQNAPLDLIIIMLGTNDCKRRFNKSAWDIAWGLDLLITYVEKTLGSNDIEPPKILVAAPIHINNDWGTSLHYTVFDQNGIEICKQLAQCYQLIARRHNCGFIDASLYGKASGDGLHMLPDSHNALGKAMAKSVKSMTGK